MSKIFKTTDEKAIGFWTIVSNCFLVVFTFWLGIVVQSLVAEKNSTVSSALANMEYVKKVKPLVDSLNIKYGPMLMEFTSIPSDKDKYGKPTFSDADNEAVLNHYNKYGASYADFFNDLSYTFAQIYEFDHDCPDIMRTSARTLPLLYPMIKSVSDNKRSSINQTVIPDEEWNSVKDSIKAIFRQPSYIRSFGITNENVDEIIGTIKQIYNEAIKTPNAKNSIIMAAEIYALRVYKWICDHNYYNPPQDTSIIGKIADNPLLSLIVFILIGIIVAQVIYRTDNWSTPSVKKSDTYLKKAADNIEEMRKNNYLYKTSIEKELKSIAEIITELTVLATPVYDKLYEQELAYISKIESEVKESGKLKEMPVYHENNGLFGQERYEKLREYRKILEEFLLNIRPPLPEK